MGGASDSRNRTTRRNLLLAGICKNDYTIWSVMNRFGDELMDVPAIIIKRIRVDSNKIILKLLKMLIEYFYCYKIHSINQFRGISQPSFEN